MIVHVNQFGPDRGAACGETLACVLEVIEESGLDARTLSALRLHLDWIQYRSNFRDAVTVRRVVGPGDGEPVALAEIAIDLRQASGPSVREPVRHALAWIRAATADDDRVYLDDFAPLRDSIIWRFNRLFWQRLADWEASAGRGFEQALPSGRSDAHHADAVADSVAEFWTLLRDLDKRERLPAEIFALEIGVGTGGRAAHWLDRFQALDEARGTGYYPRVRFLLADYSLPTLDRALETVARHRDVVSVIAMDALDPLKALSFLRYKILYVHLTNVYDNLPADELVRRDGRLYLVEARAYVARARADAIAREAGMDVATLAAMVQRLLDVGPDVLPDRTRGAAFWRAVWEALRLEERLVALVDVAEVPMPRGVHQEHLEALLGTAPDDVRFHLSRGAVESFANALPLLHPRGYLQVQDIFVTAMEEYRHGFRGPAKLDGSVVNWVNGALLAAIGARAGYDVHFAPFHYRPGSRTSILYTTQRD
jgi:hypothetical protein